MKVTRKNKHVVLTGDDWTFYMDRASALEYARMIQHIASRIWEEDDDQRFDRFYHFAPTSKY